MKITTNKKTMIVLAVFYFLIRGVPLFAVSKPTVDSLMHQIAGLYRAGQYEEAVLIATDVLKKEPENREVKKYLWTIGRILQERESNARLQKGEKEQALMLAVDTVAEERARANEILQKLEEAYKNSQNLRSPEDMLSGMEGMSQYLGKKFAEERNQALADGYFKSTIVNLTKAIGNKVFVSKKDRYAAEAWLAYYQNDWEKALKKWALALKSAPGNEQYQKQMDHLKRLMKKKKQEKKIKEWTAQAMTYQETGFYKQAGKYWKRIIRLDSGHKKALRNEQVCRKMIKQKNRDKTLASMTQKGIKLYQSGKYIEGAQQWLKVLEIEPNNKKARIWLSHVGKKLQETEKKSAEKPSAGKNTSAAETDETKAPAKDKDKAYDFYRKGLILYTEDKIPQAMQEWEQAIKFNPHLEQAHQALRQAKTELSFQKNLPK